MGCKYSRRVVRAPKSAFVACTLVGSAAGWWFYPPPDKDTVPESISQMTKRDFEREKENYSEADATLYEKLYKKASVLGSGHWCTAYKYLSEAGEAIVLKNYRQKTDGDTDTEIQKHIDGLRHEQTILEYLADASPNIVGRVHDIHVPDGAAWLTLEYCGNDLEHKDIRPLLMGNATAVLQAARGISNGLAYLHDQGVVHRDLKGNNIFTSADETNPFEGVKVGDLGGGIMLSADGMHYSDMNGLAYRGDKNDGRGSVRNRAPETYKQMDAIANGEDHTKFYPDLPSVDMWALGCVMLEAYTGQPVIQLLYANMTKEFREENELDLDKLADDNGIVWYANTYCTGHDDKAITKAPILKAIYAMYFMPNLQSYFDSIIETHIKEPRMKDVISRLLIVDASKRLRAIKVRDLISKHLGIPPPMFHEIWAERIYRYAMIFKNRYLFGSLIRNLRHLGHYWAERAHQVYEVIEEEFLIGQSDSMNTISDEF